MAIQSFKDRYLEEFYEDDIRGKKIPAAIADRLFLSLMMLDAAVELCDLKSPPGNHLKALSGKLVGRYAIRVNKQYRLIFIWNDDLRVAENVYLDAHDYR